APYLPVRKHRPTHARVFLFVGESTEVLLDESQGRFLGRAAVVIEHDRLNVEELLDALHRRREVAPKHAGLSWNAVVELRAVLAEGDLRVRKYVTKDHRTRSTV